MFNYVDVKDHSELLKTQYKTALKMVFKGGQFTDQIKDLADYEFTNNRELTVDNFVEFADFVYDAVINNEDSHMVGKAYWIRHLDSISKSQCTRKLYMAQVFYLAGVAILRHEEKVNFVSFSMKEAC